VTDNLHELARTLAALTDDEYKTVTAQARGPEPATRVDEFAQFLLHPNKPDHFAQLLDTRKEGNTDGQCE
jgi:hypothetical protein